MKKPSLRSAGTLSTLCIACIGLFAGVSGLRGENISRPAEITPGNLRCEARENPLGVDTGSPRLGWVLLRAGPSVRGARQTAYQIIAASSQDFLMRDQGDLWDTGKVDSDAMNGIPYGGKELVSSARVFWKVRVWDAGGQVSAWSAPAQWTMGILKNQDWAASWITYPGAETARTKTLGYHAAVAQQIDSEKWVQIDLGHAQKIDAVRLVPMAHDGVDGFGFPVRFKVEASDVPDFNQRWMIADYSSADFHNPGTQAVELSGSGRDARYVRVTATRLWARGNGEFCFALRQLAVESAGETVSVDAPVQAMDSVEQYGWGRAGLTDGVAAAKPPAPPALLLLRREFAVKTGLTRAVVHVTGLGHYELFLNGKKVGEDLLSPGWSNCRKTVLYDTYDVTALLKPGTNNAAGLAMGNGMYNVIGGRYTKFQDSMGPQQAIARLLMEYADGSTETVGTDARWTAHEGPVTFTCVYGGEDYDARLEPAGWKESGFPATDWPAAAPSQGPGGTLTGLSCAPDPVRAFETFKPIHDQKLARGVVVYDLGQNVSLMPRIRVTGSAGSSVKIIPSELIRDNGDIDDTMCGGNNWWKYTLKGRGEEVWFPQFYYRGARYLKVILEPAPGRDDLPVLKSIEGVVVHGSGEPAGTFSCSNELFNRIYTLVRWAQRSNMMSVLTDCPTREKLGWLEQYHLNGPALRYNWNLANFFSKGMQDMADSQLDNGFVPNIAPEYVKFGGDGDGNPFRNSPEWGASLILCPWQQLEFQGDIGLSGRYYEEMKHYVEYLDGRAENGILDFGLGDWYDIGPGNPGYSQLTPKALTATAIYFEAVRALGQLARRLGNETDAQKYAAQSAAIRTAFNQKFFDPESRQYATGSQCANAMPLVLDLVDEQNRQAVLEHLVNDVQEKGVTAGDVGYRYLLRALADGGYSGLVYSMNNQTDKPGYGMQLARGATSLTEAWDASRYSSQNHFMLGQINEWMFHDLAGIQPDAPGFKKIIIKPAIVGDLTWVKAGYDSVSGKIESEWRRKGRNLSMRVDIPANTTALIAVPAEDVRAVRESDVPAADAPGVSFVRKDPSCVWFQVGSGVYLFKTVLP